MPEYAVSVNLFIRARSEEEAQNRVSHYFVRDNQPEWFQDMTLEDVSLVVDDTVTGEVE